MKNLGKLLTTMVAVSVCVSSLTQYNFFDSAADSSQANIDYAISLMGKFAMYLDGDFHNPDNHSLAPLAVGGNIDVGKVLITDNRNYGFFRGEGYDFVLGGSTLGNGGKCEIEVKDADREYCDIAYVEGIANIVPSWYMNDGDRSPLHPASSKDNLPIDFATATSGFKALSDSLAIYAQENENSINVAPSTNPVLVGTGEYNVFNLSSSTFYGIEIDVPMNSHVIINVPGEYSGGTHIDITMNYISNIVVNPETNEISYEKTEAFECKDTKGEESIKDPGVHYSNQNVVFNFATSSKIPVISNGTVLAPRATLKVDGGGCANGGYFINAINSSACVEMHGGNMNGDFTWLNDIKETKLADITISTVGVSGHYDNDELPGVVVKLTGVDPDGEPIDLSSTELDLGVTADQIPSSNNYEVLWNTGSTTTTVKGLPDGYYTLTETDSPDGYNVTDPSHFTVKDGKVYEGDVIDYTTELTDKTLNLYNYSYTDVIISKQGNGGDYDGLPLPGAVLELRVVDDIDVFDPNGDYSLGEDATLKSITSRTITWKTGTTQSTITLPNATYVLTELNAPDNYEIAEAIQFTVKDGDVRNIAMVDEASIPTPTIEPTDTPSPTPPSTPSATPSTAPSVTPNPTGTPSATPSAEPSSTPDPTNTPSATPSAEPSSTPDPTDTPSVTPSAEPSSTPVPTDIPSVTPSAEPSSTPNPTGTPSATPSAEPSSTPDPTDTPSVTPAAEPSSTPDPTGTPSATPSAEPSSTPDPTGTPSATPSAEPSSTPNPTGTPSATPSAEPSSTPDPTGTPSATPSAEPSSTPDPTGTPSATPSAEPSSTPAVTPSDIVITPAAVVTPPTHNPTTPVPPTPDVHYGPSVTPVAPPTDAVDGTAIDPTVNPSIGEDGITSIQGGDEITNIQGGDSLVGTNPTDPTNSLTDSASLKDEKSGITSTGESQSMTWILAIASISMLLLSVATEQVMRRKSRR